jgi:YD repeat-containing protein
MQARDQAAEGYSEPSSRAEKEATAAPAPAARAPEKKRAAEQAAPSAAPEPSGAAAVERRSFPGCAGERRRVVERDADGRVVRYVREGELRTIEQRYSPAGRLVEATAIEGGVRRPLPLDAPGLVRDARDAGIDAPPRCSTP